MQMDVHKTLYPLYITKEMPHIPATATKMHFFGSSASFSLIIKLRCLLLEAVTVSLHYLSKMSAFTSHMQQNTNYRNLKQWRSQTKILEGPNILTLSEQQCLVWDTAPRSTKRQGMLDDWGARPLWPPWLRL